MRKRAIAAVVLLLAAGAAYAFLLRDKPVEPRVAVPTATATIGEGSDAVAVGPRGRIHPWLPLPGELRLPRLPLEEPPASGRLRGPMLEQARVLGAAPAALRPYIESSHLGETGVDVVLRTDIELRFGDATRAARKWEAAAAVLADPSVEALDYVDLHAPRRPAIDGSGHTLPPIP